MIINKIELNINLTDSSVEEFKEQLINELQKLIKTPFAMNSESQSKQIGEQEMLKNIIEYLNKI